MNLFIDYKDFILGIYSGLAVAALVYTLGKLVRLLKNFFLNQRFINIWTKSKILYIYDNQMKAAEQMCEDARHSEIVFVFSSIELSFFHVSSDFYELLRTKNGDIKLIFIDPDSPHDTKRIEELDYAWASETTKAFAACVKDLEKANTNIKLTFHKEFIRNKFYIFDDVMYLGFRLKDRLSEKSYIWRIGKDSYLYKAFLEQFNDYWKKYQPVQEEESTKS